MSYDSWKSDVDASVSERELAAEREQYEREAAAEYLPHYALHTWYDPWPAVTWARLRVKERDGHWRTLAEGNATGDDPAAAIRSLRYYLRRARGVL